MNFDLMNKAATMPPLPHWPDKETQPYDVMNSRVADWLIKQPEAREWIVAQARSFGAIVYDAEKNLWAGSGKKFDGTFTKEEILSVLGDDQMRMMDLLATCVEKYGRMVTRSGFSMSVKRMVAAGELTYNHKLNSYRVTPG